MNIMNIPNGKSGDWEIEEFEVPEDSLQNFRFALQGRYCDPGKYKRLMRNRQTIMSNTPAELADHRHFVHKAKGNVLINGLGLGCVLSEVLEKESVERVTVIEKSKDVIKLIAPHFKDKRVNIIHADAYDWKPPKGVRYDAVWHDIWDSICEDNLPEMGKLHRKYGRRCDFQDSWSKDLCKRLERKGDLYGF